MNEPGNKACSVTSALPDPVERVARAIRRQKFERSGRLSAFDETNISDDERDEARAAIAAMPGWQPIETAPKDREILICGGTRRDESFDYGDWDSFTDVALAQYDKSKDCWEGEQTEQYESFILYRPTHWQEKPKPYSAAPPEVQP